MNDRRRSPAVTLAAAVLLLLILLVAGTGTAAGAVGCEPVNSATVINQSGCYELTTDLTASSDPIIEINASNVVFDGRNFELGNGDPAIHIMPGVSNVTIRNVTVSSSDDGIHVEEASDVTIDGVTTRENYDGIWIEYSSDVTIRNVEHRYDEYHGILAEDSVNVSVDGVTTSLSDGEGFDDHVIYFDSTNGTITDSVLEAGEYGQAIYLDESNGTVIDDVFANVTDADYTLEVEDSYNVVVRNSTFVGHEAYDSTVYVDDSPNVSLTNVSIDGGEEFGLDLSGSANATMRNVSIDDTRWGLYISGYFRHDIDQSNTVDGLPVYIYEGLDGVAFDGSVARGYFAVVDSTDIALSGVARNDTGQGFVAAHVDGLTIESSTFANDSHGISVVDSTDVEIRDVNVSDSRYGVYLNEVPGATVESLTALEKSHWSGTRQALRIFNSPDLTVANGTFDRMEVWVSDSDRLEVYDGTFTGTQVEFYGSSDVVIHDNDFSDSGAAIDVQDFSRRATISNNTLVGMRSSAISLTGNSDDAIVRDNDVIDVDKTTANSGDAIYVRGVSDILVRDNTLNDLERGGIALAGGSGTVVENNTITDADFGVGMTENLDTDGFVLRNNTIDGVTDGVSIDDFAADAIITGNVIRNASSSGISAVDSTLWSADSTNVTIADNDIQFVNASGVFLSNVEDYTASNNTFENGTTALGISINSGVDVTVVDNFFDGFGRQGAGGASEGAITVTASTNVDVRSNRLDSSYVGVHVDESSTNILVVDNLVYSANHSGILLDHLLGGTVENNTVTEASAGVQLIATSDVVVRENQLRDSDRGLAFVQVLSDVDTNFDGNETYTWTLPSTNVTVVRNVLEGNVESVNFTVAPYQVIDDGESTTVTEPSFEAGDEHLIYDNIFNGTVAFQKAYAVDDSLLPDYERDVFPNDWNVSATAGSNIVGGPSIGGNYWTNSSGTGFSETCDDIDDDGFCDNPFELAGANNTDMLPLVDPSTATPEPTEPGALELSLNNTSTSFAAVDGEFGSQTAQQIVAMTDPAIADHVYEDETSYLTFVENLHPYQETVGTELDGVASASNLTAYQAAVVDLQTALDTDDAQQVASALENVSAAAASLDEPGTLELSLHNTSTSFTAVDDEFGSQTAQQIVAMTDQAIADGDYADESSYVTFVANLYTNQQTIETELDGVASTSSLEAYQVAVDGLQTALNDGSNAIEVAAAQKNVSNAASSLEPKEAELQSSLLNTSAAFTAVHDEYGSQSAQQIVAMTDQAIADGVYEDESAYVAFVANVHTHQQSVGDELEGVISASSLAVYETAVSDLQTALNDGSDAFAVAAAQENVTQAADSLEPPGELETSLLNTSTTFATVHAEFGSQSAQQVVAMSDQATADQAYADDSAYLTLIANLNAHQQSVGTELEGVASTASLTAYQTAVSTLQTELGDGSSASAIAAAQENVSSAAASLESKEVAFQSSLHNTSAAFTAVDNEFGSQTAQQIVAMTDQAIADGVYEDETNYVAFVGTLLVNQQSVGTELEGVASTASLTAYQAAVSDLQTAVATSDAQQVAPALENVSDTVHALEHVDTGDEGDGGSANVTVHSITVSDGTYSGPMPYVEAEVDAQPMLQLNLRTSQFGDYDLESMGFDNTTEFEIDLTVENFTPRLLLGAGAVTSWERTANGTSATDVTVLVRPVATQSIWECDGGGNCTTPSLNDWPEGANDTATNRTNVTVSMAVDDLGVYPTAQRNALDGTVVTTDAQLFGDPTYTPATAGQPATLSLLVGGPHFTVDGTENQGFYDALLPKSLIDAWGITDPGNELSAAYDGQPANFSANETAAGDVRIEVDVHYSAGEVSVSAATGGGGSGGGSASSGSTGSSDPGSSDDEPTTTETTPTPTSTETTPTSASTPTSGGPTTADTPTGSDDGTPTPGASRSTQAPPTTSSPGQPGFGLLVTVLALLAGLLVAGRRR